jgi:hypothetical protein
MRAAAVLVMSSTGGTGFGITSSWRWTSVENGGVYDANASSTPNASSFGLGDSAGPPQAPTSKGVAEAAMAVCDRFSLKN